MLQDIASYEGRIAKVRGGAACGKTEALIQRALLLLKRGVDPSSIYIEASTASAANTLRRRLIAEAGDELGAAASSVPVDTALSASIRVLQAPDAVKMTGRHPRILNDAEYKFFLEDMKTLGLPIRRLRKILGHFYERWCHGADESTWLQSGDESSVFTHSRKLLESLDAMLPEEAPLLAMRYLQSKDGSKDAHAYDYMLCDDFQNMTRAEQSCMCLLAGNQLIVFGDPNEVSVSDSRHPNPEGFTEFDVRRKNVDVFELDESYADKSASAFADALLSQSGMDASYAAKSAEHVADGVECIKWKTPEEELDGLTKILRVRLDQAEDLYNSDVCIVVPNKRWARSVEKILKKRGFPTTCAGIGLGLPGDPRENWERSALAAYVRLGLLAHPDDTMLWRCWCGFGNYLTNSDKWDHLMGFAEEKGLTLLDALQKLLDYDAADEPFLGAGKLRERVQEGNEFIKKNAKRKGFVLLRSVGASNIREFEDAIEKIDGDEDAQELFTLISDSASNPTFPDNSRVIRIATYENMSGIQAEVVVLFAVVDGFMPNRNAFEVVSTEAERDRVMIRDRKLLHSIAAKAHRRLIISYFSQSDLELAERSKMQVARVRSENGQRVARIRPSVFLREAGAACPVTVGGQAMLAELGLM